MEASGMDWNSDTSEIYPIISQCDYIRKAVIIYTFPPNDPDAYATGDFLLMKSLLKKLKFNVIAIPNPTPQKLHSKLSKVRRDINANHNEHDMFCLVFLGHGGRIERTRHEYIILKDGTMNIDELQDKFLTSSCPGLAGCPKIFIFHCCRGLNEERVTKVIRSAAEVQETSQHIDFYTLYACVSGYRSFYDELSGTSAFVTTLCDVFSKDYKIKDITRMAVKVTREIPKKNQTVEQRSTLSRLLYFDGIRASGLPQHYMLHKDVTAQSHSHLNASLPSGFMHNYDDECDVEDVLEHPVTLSQENIPSSTTTEISDNGRRKKILEERKTMDYDGLPVTEIIWEYVDECNDDIMNQDGFLDECDVEDVLEHQIILAHENMQDQLHYEHQLQYLTATYGNRKRKKIYVDWIKMDSGRFIYGNGTLLYLISPSSNHSPCKSAGAAGFETPTH